MGDYTSRLQNKTREHAHHCCTVRRLEMEGDGRKKKRDYEQTVYIIFKIYYCQDSAILYRCFSAHVSFVRTHSGLAKKRRSEKQLTTNLVGI